MVHFIKRKVHHPQQESYCIYQPFVNHNQLTLTEQAAQIYMGKNKWVQN